MKACDAVREVKAETYETSMASILEIARKNLHNFKSVVDELGNRFLKIKALHEQQLDAMKSFLFGQHVMVNAPTGFGKSLIFQMLPYVVDSLTESQLGTCTMVVVCPLVSLMIDQVNSLKSKGINACYLTAQTMLSDIITENGTVIPSLIFCSPEGYLSSSTWRKLLNDPNFKSSCIGVTIDEAHCISSWYVYNI